MAQSTLTPSQSELFKRMESAQKSNTSKGHRHPLQAKATPWLMGRVEDTKALASGSPAISWWVNPSQCQWKVATRTTIEKISGGVVHHEWPQIGTGLNTSFYDSRFDQPTLSITFQSGIITPGGYEDISLPSSDTLPAGLGNFFDFLDLLDQPDTTTNGAPNYINILYSSSLFGAKGLWLQGFFTEEGVSWTDSAENPNMVTSWGATFMVFNSQPPLSMLKNHFELIGIPTF